MPKNEHLLTGVPDEIWRHPQRGLWIDDYKCARFTDTQDELIPMYEAQLSAYAFIAHRIALGPVYGLGLLYHEPVTNLEETALAPLIEGFSMRFSPKSLPIRLNPEMIPELLQQVRQHGRDRCLNDDPFDCRSERGGNAERRLFAPNPGSRLFCNGNEF